MKSSRKSILPGIVVGFFMLTWIPVLSQPAYLGTELVNGVTYMTYPLTDLGIFRQVRLQADNDILSFDTKWEFADNTLSYDPVWRPWSGACNGNPNVSIPGFNGTISPNTIYPNTYASGVYNTGFGGCGGFLPDVTANHYYTFNITEYSLPGANANEYMGVLETTWEPIEFTSLVQSPASGIDYSTFVTITVTLSDVPSPGEYIYLRYAPTYNFTGSNILDMYVSGYTATATIPCQVQDSIYYYVYSSNRTKPEIAAEVTTYGQVAHDMLTLNLINNGGPNYFYTIIPTGTCAVLPVAWLDFVVESTGQTVLLDWWTASESNSDHFEVQRSVDGVQWQVIGQLQAAGQSLSTRHYSFTDDAPLTGRSYYRLLQVDQDGTTDPSEIRQVVFHSTEQVQLFPNPSSGTFRIRIFGQDGGQAICRITDMTGQLVWQEDFLLDGWSTTQTIGTPLSAGIYQCAITVDGRLEYLQKLIIQR